MGQGLGALRLLSLSADAVFQVADALLKSLDAYHCGSQLLSQHLNLIVSARLLGRASEFERRARLFPITHT